MSALINIQSLWQCNKDSGIQSKTLHLSTIHTKKRNISNHKRALEGIMKASQETSRGERNKFGKINQKLLQAIQKKKSSQIMTPNTLTNVSMVTQ